MKERGLSESAGWTLLTPLTLLFVLGIIQVGLWGYSYVVALDAAIVGAERTALAGAQAGDGEVAAREIADGGGLKVTTLEVSKDTTVARARVCGTVANLIDVGLTRVDVSVSRPVETAAGP